jgi:two-component system, sensor histidine kinase and response regulator
MGNTNDAPDKATILIVDDTPTNITLLTELLKGQYRLRVATNGIKALDALGAGEPPDLVLLDIMMPEMDGYEVCRRMKENDAVKDVPVIFLSALNETMDKVRAFSVGGVDYVTKPFQVEEVRARVETHLKIRSLQKELEQKHGQLQENYTQLRDLSDLKDEFLRIASHDLKNPLMCVLGFACLVEDLIKPGTPMTEDMHVCVGKIADAARLMQKIIEDFLDFRAMEDGQMKVQLADTDMNDLTRQVVEANQTYAAKKSIPVSFEPAAGLPPARADASRIRQVVENFVGNAIKFSAADKPVTVRTSHSGATVLIEVVDSGPGLTEDDLAKLFTKYAKLSNKPTGGEKSSGLGLAICRKIVELHEGRIGARNNTTGGGCTFWFEVPAAG